MSFWPLFANVFWVELTFRNVPWVGVIFYRNQTARNPKQIGSYVLYQIRKRNNTPMSRFTRRFRVALLLYLYHSAQTCKDCSGVPCYDRSRVVRIHLVLTYQAPGINIYRFGGHENATETIEMCGLISRVSTERQKTDIQVWHKRQPAMVRLWSLSYWRRPCG